jgi:hypothetical protein
MNPENSSFENSKIEKLKKALYSRNAGNISNDVRAPIAEREVQAPTSWGQQKTFEYTEKNMTKKGSSNSFFNKFLLFSFSVFIISLAIALFIFFGGINMISSNNLDVKIIAPSSVSSGEELPIGLSIINGNRTDLEEVSLYIDYPDGSQEINSDKVLKFQKVNLGTIAKGGSTEYSIRSVLFGEKDSTKSFVFKIEYKVKGSNATFSKEKSYDVVVGSAPIIMDVKYPSETNSGQDIKLTVIVTSNSPIVMKNTLVKIDYPYGFTYKSSSIKPLRDNSVWNVGDLKDGEKKIIDIVGTMVGQNQEDKTFRIVAGTQSSDNTKDFDAELANEDITIGIRKSFFDLTLEPSVSQVKIGDTIPVYIKWQNTLPEKILNTKMTATISGNVFDRSKVSVGGGGYYESINNSVVWDKNNVSSLAQMLPGQGGEASLTLVSITDQFQVRQIKNPHIDIKLVITGDRSEIGGEKVSSESNIVIKILSTLSFTGKTYRSTGPFTNSGPIPPRADQESTYTISWALTNTTNDLSGTIVKGKLPIGITWKGEVSPASEKISYDPDTRTVTWNAGNISAGVGFNYSPKEVSFKVGIVPSISQISTIPELVNKIDVTATDTYVEAPINYSVNALTTDYSDPSYKSGDGAVLK